MSLVDKARGFIEYGTGPGGADEIALLCECVEAGTLDALHAVQLIYEDMYGGITFNYQIKAPAAWCLVRWGEHGLDALVEAAQRTPTSKNRSLTIEILATLAAREKLPQTAMWIGDEPLLRRLLELVDDWESLYSAARRKLGTFVLSFEDDEDAAMSIGMQFHTASLKGSGIIKPLFAAMAGRWLAVSLPTLAEFTSLLRDHSDDEPRLQLFLEQHPQLLDPMAFEVYPRPRIHGAREPDFILRRTDDSYLVVEIETPHKSMLTASNRLSAEATHAVAQVTDYAAFLSERLQSVRQSLPSFRQPECLVVVGVEARLSADQVRALRVENESRHRVRVVGFDWLVGRAEAIVSNVVAQEIRVIRDLRIV